MQNNNNDINNNNISNDEEEPLALPWKNDNFGESPPQNQSDGACSETLKLDHLGPIVINSDGSTSRITNWDKMTEIEQQRTLKIIAKRNQTRRENLGEITF